MMTRKTFQLVADAIKQAKKNNPAIDGRSANIEAGIRMAAHELAKAFQAENPRFKRDRFMEACGLE